MAGISYDSQAILKDFAARRNIGFPLLADPESKIITAFGVLNTQAPKGTPYEGMTLPITFVADAGGKVTSKFFEEDYRERFTMGNILLRTFGGGAESGSVSTRSPGVSVRTIASNATLRPGQRVTLGVEMSMQPGTHLYAPGSPAEFKAVEFKIEENAAWKRHPAIPPAGRPMRFEALKMTAPVYEGKLQWLEDVTVAANVRTPEVTIPATLRIQACTEKECFPPETLQLSWTLKLERLDSERVAPELRKR